MRVLYLDFGIGGAPIDVNIMPSRYCANKADLSLSREYNINCNSPVTVFAGISLNPSPAMPLKHCNYWIFDMDGTLTLPIHDFEAIRAALGIPCGTPILEAIDAMPPRNAEESRQLLHDLEMELAHEATPQPEVASILQRLQDSGRRLGILTRNDEDITRVTLEAAGLTEFFNEETIVGRESCLPKPNPDGVFRLLDVWNASKQETVIVGDYLYDIQAGFEAGIQTVHYDHTGLFPWPEFTHHRIVSISDLGRFF